MLKRIVKEIKGALENELYISALSLALIIPDICGKVKYPDLRTGERYVKWYNEFVSKNFLSRDEVPEFYNESLPKVDGNLIYKLRCSMLHEGDPNVTKDKHCDVDFFKLVTERDNPCHIYAGNCLEVSQDSDGKTTRTVSINIRSFCAVMIIIAMNYYNDNKSGFHFNYKVIDLEQYYEQM